MKYYKDFAHFLEKYEDSKNATSNQTGALAHVKLISGGEQDALKQKLDTMTEKQTNPVRHINYWVKGEVLGLDSLIAAINYKDSIDDLKKKTQSNISDLTDDINKLNAGKFTFRGMLKSESQKKESAVQKATVKAEMEKDLINYDVIKKFLTIYLCTIAIPDFKKQRVEAYMRAMSRMTKDEVANANYTLDCWSSFGQKVDQYNIK